MLQEREDRQDLDPKGRGDISAEIVLRQTARGHREQMGAAVGPYARYWYVETESTRTGAGL